MAKEDKKEKEKPEEVPAKKGGALKWIIIAGVMGVVLGGAGYISWKTFLHPAPQPQESSEGEIAVKDELGPMFPLDAFIVNLTGTSGERYLKVSLQLELGKVELTEEVEKRVPQLRDTILLLLSSKTFEDIGTYSGKTKLRSEITARLNGMLPPGSIKKVYFTEFVVQ
jgi:flagellar FliL protein